MKLLQPVLNRLRIFKAETEGSVTIEAVLLMPMLFWIYLSMFSIFDAFRQYSINQKAAYTLSDLLSRETQPITGAYLDSMSNLLEYMVVAEATPMLRVSLIRFKEDENEYHVEWSQKRGTIGALTTDSTKNWHHKLPIMLNNEYIIVVETWTEYDPPFNTGLEQRTIQNFVFTRPRYAPQLVWDGETT